MAADGRDHLRDPRRALAAAVGVVALLLLFDPQATGTVQRYLLPVIATGLCQWLTRSVLVTALSVGLLALGHSDLDAADVYAARILPAVALAALLVVAVIAARRFAATVRATRAGRRARRREGTLH